MYSTKCEIYQHIAIESYRIDYISGNVTRQAVTRTIDEAVEFIARRLALDQNMHVYFKNPNLSQRPQELELLISRLKPHFPNYRNMFYIF